MLWKQNEQITDEDLKAIPSVGSMVWWNLEDVQAPEEMVRNLIAQNGLDINNLSIPDEKTIFVRSVNALHDRTRTATEKVMVRFVEDDAYFMRYQITKETLEQDDEGSELTYETDGFAVLDKSDLSVDIELPDDLQEEFENNVEHFSEYLIAEDIRKFIQRTIEKAIPTKLRSHGGLYFVPKPLSDTVVPALDNLVSNISDQSEFCWHPVLDHENFRNRVFEMFTKDLKGMIKSANAELQGMEDELAADSDSIRASVIERRLLSYRERANEVKAYGQALHYTTESLDKELNALSTRAKKVLNLTE